MPPRPGGVEIATMVSADVLWFVSGMVSGLAMRLHPL
jgi:hypothetical protein